MAPIITKPILTDGLLTVAAKGNCLDTRIFSPLLYQLSYSGGMNIFIPGDKKKVKRILLGGLRLFLQAGPGELRRC